MSDARLIRHRQEDLRSAADRLPAFAEDGGLAVLAQTTTLSQYPTSPEVFYACVPLRVDGAEVEGAAASFLSDPARTLLALNLGSMVPPVNTKVILHACGGRWTFRYDG